MRSEIGRSLDSIVRSSLSPLLEPAGFRRKARAFHRASSDATHVVNVQGSKYNEGANGEFTINLGVYFPAAAALLEPPAPLSDTPGDGQCLVRIRIGHLMPRGEDHWWSINRKTDLSVLGREVAGLLREHGLPWFETVPDLRAAGQRLEEDGSLYLAAVAALAAGDRPLAASRLAEALARFPDPTILLSWGTRHGLL